MGYFTRWKGSLTLRPPLLPEGRTYLHMFLNRRHVLTQGPEQGEFDVYPIPNVSVVDYNRPPPNQPFIWCDWEIDETGSVLSISRDRNYRSVEWLAYLIRTFFIPAGTVVSGHMVWSGEEPGDEGTLTVRANCVLRTFAASHGGQGLSNPFVETYLSMERDIVTAFSDTAILHDRTGVEDWMKKETERKRRPQRRHVCPDQ